MDAIPAVQERGFVGRRIIRSDGGDIGRVVYHGEIAQANTIPGVQPATRGEMILVLNIIDSKRVNIKGGYTIARYSVPHNGRKGGRLE